MLLYGQLLLAVSSVFSPYIFDPLLTAAVHRNISALLVSFDRPSRVLKPLAISFGITVVSILFASPTFGYAGISGMHATRISVVSANVLLGVVVLPIFVAFFNSQWPLIDNKGT